MAENVRIYNADDMAFEKLSANPLTLVDFWATWCGPCRMMAPIIESLAAKMPNVVFAKLDVDQNPEVAMGLNIASIPTLMLFKNGQMVERVIGVTPEDELKKLIEKHI
ncbi:MAG: thioredoxin [Clostridia bacterium]|nr:thioredoxin [Clostridia bacterium]